MIREITMRHGLVLFALLCSSLPAAAETATIQTHTGAECVLQLQREPSAENNRRALDICYLAVSERQGSLDTFVEAYARTNLSAAYLRVKDFSSAVAEARKATDLLPGLAPAYANLGAGLLGVGQFRDAVTALDNAVKFNDQSVHVYYNRAIAKEYLGDIRGAYYDFRKATEVDPNFRPAAEELTRFKVVTRGS